MNKKDESTVVEVSFPIWFVNILEAVCKAHGCKYTIEAKNDPVICIVCRKMDSWEKIHEFVMKCPDCGYTVLRSKDGHAPVVTGKSDERRACLTELVERLVAAESDAETRFPGSVAEQRAFMNASGKELIAKAPKAAKSGATKATKSKGVTKQLKQAKKEAPPIDAKLNNEIYDIAAEIWKLTSALEFKGLEAALVKLQTAVKKGNELAAANTDPAEFIGYPFDRVSDYQDKSVDAGTLSKVKEKLSEFKCDCDPTKCECKLVVPFKTEDGSKTCRFCDASIARFSDAFMSTDASGTESTMCVDCGRTLMSELQPRRSRAEGVSTLIEDACNETRFLQFNTSLKLIERAVELAEGAV